MISKLLAENLVLLLLISAVSSSHLHLDLDTRNPAFDPAIYEDALDPELCRQQLNYIQRNNTVLRLQFIDAGMRLPKAIREFNNLHLGNYDQCLGINHETTNSVIEGKYCMIRGPMDNENLEIIAKALSWEDYDPDFLNDGVLRKFREIEGIKEKTRFHIRSQPGDIINILDVTFPEFQMALCVPKTCTSDEGMAGILLNLTRLGFRYEEQFCRFKDDKPWVPADYVAIAVFSLIGLLTIVSTAYDIWHIFIKKTDPKTISTLCRSFSVYTNGKTLSAISRNPNNLDSIDGIRAISMFWIVFGHTYDLMPPAYNNPYIVEWLYDSWKSVWIIMAPFSVDTFFTLAGLLLVYTTAGKLSGKKLLKNLHLFYLNRLLRMFPILAATILLQASVFHRVADGPLWNLVSWQVNACRTSWWTTLLYVQNYVNSRYMCIDHSWYLAIDIQCYLVSPIILYWVLNGKKNQAWIALTCGVLASLIAATTYSFIYKFPGWILAPVREGGEPEYHLYYYFNTLTRAPPFVVGMFIGYILHVWRGKKPEIPIYVSASLWLFSALFVTGATYTVHSMRSATWDTWVIDDLFNSFSRSLWALAIGWVIFACQHGYSGPINWFLSLDIWKLPSKVSFAMYLLHFQIQHILYGITRQPIFFSDGFAMYQFMAQVTKFFGVSYIATLVIDAPFAVLVKLVLGNGPKKPSKEVADKEG